MLESGFVRFVGYDGRESFGALWSARDRIAKHDRPLGSRRQPEDARENEGEIRVGYDVRRYLFGDDAAGLERLELRDVAELELDGERLAEHCGGHFIAVVPDTMGGRHYCGGRVVATVYLAGYEPSGLPCVRVAYVSRYEHGEHAGKLHIAIPG